MKRYLVIIGVLLFMISGPLLGPSETQAFTDHRFVVNTDKQGCLFIDSFPDEMNNIPDENYPHYLICLCREKNVWDDIGLMAGLQNCSVAKSLEAVPKIKELQKALDKVIPARNSGGKLICFSYILCYHDAVIYFEEEYTLEQMCVIAEKLNVERQNYR